MASNDQQSFAWYEYVVFSSMFVATGAIGLYFGFTRKKTDNTVKEYMFGGGKMPVLPIALSLIASFGSGLNLLGLPAEVYVFGTQIGAVMLSILLATIFLNIFFLPIIYNLNASSMFEGGLKAVAWSDALQSIFIAAAMITVLILGIVRAGGISNIMATAGNGERLEFFNFDVDPTRRNTFWTVVIGMTFTWVKFLALDPVSFQRYASVATYRQARQVSWIMCAGVIVTKIICLSSGLIIYAYYHDCDPVMTKKVSKPGQILPYYALDIAGKYPGFNGIFLAGVIGTALSSLSTSLNTLSGTLLDDFIRPLSPKKINDSLANIILKMTVVILGIVAGALVFLVEKMGTIMQGAIALNGIACGGTLFIYIFGMFYPWGNAKGAICGTLAGMAATIWIATGAQLAIISGDIKYPGKVMSTAGCSSNQTIPDGLNSTFSGFPGYGTEVIISNDVPYLYRLSYLYYGLIALTFGSLVAVLVSLFTGNQDLTKLDPKLIIPQLRQFLPKDNDKDKFYIKEIENDCDKPLQEIIDEDLPSNQQKLLQ
uniref:Uncharacterized protein n=1 Tax=Rhodnius prolixus TaxID=13249 RepID=T1IET1_RHOPR